MKTILPIIFFLNLFSSTFALNNGLGKTPPMGWSSWNLYGVNISDALIRTQADAMVSTGLSKLGYNYLNIDDGWASETRSKNGSIMADPDAFPHGMEAIGDYIHSKGLKFGIYSDAGDLTCAGRQGSLNVENNDADTFASWGVDYLKYDDCLGNNRPGSTAYAKDRYGRMRDALNATGRPIFYAMCVQGFYETYKWGSNYGNSYRLSFDIKGFWGRTLAVYDVCVPNVKYSKPYSWGDADMLEVGLGLLDEARSRSHFSLWAAMKSPLIIGVNMQNITEDVLEILSNTEIIALNQDPLGIPATRIKHVNDSKPYDILMGPLSGNTYTVLLFNRGNSSRSITWNMTTGPYPLKGNYVLRDLWAHKDLGVYSGSFTTRVSKDTVIALKVTPTNATTGTFTPTVAPTATTVSNITANATDPPSSTSGAIRAYTFSLLPILFTVALALGVNLIV